MLSIRVVYELVWVGFGPKLKMVGLWFSEPNRDDFWSVRFLRTGVGFGGFPVSWVQPICSWVMG